MWRLLQRIEEFPQLDGRAQLEGLAVEVGMVGSTEFIDSGLALLRQMHGEGVIGIVA